MIIFHTSKASVRSVYITGSTPTSTSSANSLSRNHIVSRVANLAYARLGVRAFSTSRLTSDEFSSANLSPSWHQFFTGVSI